MQFFVNRCEAGRVPAIVRRHMSAAALATFAVCAAIKLCGLLPGSPESVLVARGRFLSIYAATLATLALVVAACLAARAAAPDNALLVVGLVSSWFVLQRLAMLWSAR